MTTDETSKRLEERDVQESIKRFEHENPEPEEGVYWSTAFAKKLAMQRITQKTVTLHLEEGKSSSVSLVESLGGAPGDGTLHTLIFKLDEYPEQFWRLDGDYDSWEGTVWNSCDSVIEVFPKVVHMIRYELTP